MKLNHLYFLLLAGMLLTACVDDDFDVPPVNGEDPGLTANFTIGELRDLVDGDNLTTITEDHIIRGVVVADDRAGNWFRSFILQDSTGGIEVNINLADAYVYYSVGREVYIKLNGLVVGTDAGNFQLGGYIITEGGGQELGNINDLPAHLFEGRAVGEPAPDVQSIAELNDDDLQTLVQLTEVEFADADTGQPFADPVGQSTVNRTLQDCDGNTIVVRTSGFSTFAGDLTPEGLGTVTGVYSQFFGTQQLFIRGPEDVQFDDRSCGQGNPEDYLSIGAVRDLFAGGATVGPASAHIVGTVISDAANANVQSRNLFLQDGDRGIVVRFASAHSFQLGDVLDVRIGGEELSEFNGLLQVNNLPLAKATKTGTAEQPEPTTLTVAELLANGEQYESTLVRIEDATWSGNPTFDFLTTVDDGTGEITHFTTSFATFANEPLPDDALDVVAIASQGGNQQEYQLTIRNLGDLEGYDGGGGGGGGGGPTDPLNELNEDFDSGIDDADISLPGWFNIAVQGNRLWRFNEFSGNVYAQATAFQDNSDEMEAWLITPALDFDEVSEMSFLNFQAFYNHDGLSVWVSNDFDGTDVEGATWTELTDYNEAGSGQDNYDFVPSGTIDLSAFSGTGHIGFRYTGEGPMTATTTFAIDDLVIE